MIPILPPFLSNFGVDTLIQIHDSEIYGNGNGLTTFDIYNMSPINIDASHCYWGEATTEEMNNNEFPTNITMIYDQRDNAFFGEVIYANWIGGVFQPDPFDLIGPGEGDTCFTLD
ncbi:hypothetical protein KKG16_03545, partial [Patescibacteria group bacterium]|nr:hypothetical protein [Patescibacteria group bacterium]